MLALMPPSSTTSDLHSQPYTSMTAMSVAVLPPSPALHGQVSMFAPRAAPSKRPKLSLNTTTTAESPYRSKQSTSLRLETLSATSPTDRNTFGNAYARPKGSKPALPILTRRDSARADTPVAEQAIVLTAAEPLSATCEVEPTAEIIPYNLDNVNSILRNSRRKSPRKSLSQSKPMFSITKRVIFRAPLTEEVKNKQYTLRHSDIMNGSTTPISAVESAEQVARALAARTITPLSTDIAMEEDDSTSTCPVTPVAGRRKKDRQWYWTLGPERFNGALPSTDSATPSPTTLEDTS